MMGTLADTFNIYFRYQVIGVAINDEKTCFISIVLSAV